MRMRVSELRTSNINTALAANEKGMMITSSTVEVTATASNLILSVPNDLGMKPDDFQYSRMDNASVGLYATRAQRGMWPENGGPCEISASAAGEFRVWFVKRIP